VTTAQVKTIERTASNANQVSSAPSKPFPELRVIQPAITNLGDGRYHVGDEHAFDWVNYLNNLGEKNRGKGMARSLGSMCITLVPAKEIGRMVEAKHGDRFKEPSEAKKLLAGLAIRTRAFLNNATATARDLQEASLYQQGTWDEVSNFSFNSEVEVIDEITRYPEDGDSQTMSTLQKLEAKEYFDKQLRRHVFGEAVYETPPTDALQPYSRNAFGIDLSGNEHITNQRDVLKSYLQVKEGLDIGLMDPHWKAHLVVFNLFPHRTVENTGDLDTRGHPEPPVYISVAEPRVDMSGEDAILYE
jgi:hypothetical protein